MKKLIFSLSVFLISAPLIAQTNFSGAGTTISPVTGAPVLDPSNTSAVPPTLDRTNPVNSTGAETSGAASGFGTSPSGSSTGFGTGSGTGIGTGMGVPSSQPGSSIMNPGNQSGSHMSTGWQGK